MGHPRCTWEENREAGSENVELATSSKRTSLMKALKSLFQPKSSASTADQREEPSAKSFWPDEYLVEDIPEARVWTYGYNADVIGGLFQTNNQNSVSKHGQDLAVRLERDIVVDNNEVDLILRPGQHIQTDDIRTRSYSLRTASAALLLNMYVCGSRVVTFMSTWR